MMRFLIEKEVRQIFRNAFLPRLVVMMPLMMMLVLPWAASQEVTDLGLCIVDHDRSAASSRLIRKVTAGDYFRPAATAGSYEEALRTVGRNEADLILEVPRGFERRAARGLRPEVFIAANAVNGTKGMMGSAYLAQIVAGAGGELFDHSPQRARAERVSLQYRYNAALDYKVFMVPAMMVMLLTLMAGFLPALSIVGEKEAGTMEQINVSPVGRLAFVVAKLLPYWAIGLLVMTICLCLAAVVYGLVPSGSLLTVYALAIVYIMVVSGMGLIISNYSERMQQAVFVMYFFVMVLLLMSGLLTPVSSMPDWAQWVAACNPLRYFVEAMRAVFLKGSTLADLSADLLALLGFATIFSTWAVFSFRKR